jgi:hypothetical protein
MRAVIETDTTVRTIRVKVEAVPEIDVTRSYHRKPRIFRPEYVVITLKDGVVSQARVTGGLVLKSGKASTEVGESETWSAGSWNSPKLAEAPAWLARLVDEAPSGVTTWRDLDTTNPDEVTAL